MRRFVQIGLALVLLGGAGRAQDPAAEFESGLRRVGEQMGRRQWRPAYESLQRLLAEHSRAPYAMRRRVEIEEAVKRCVFYRTVRAPALDGLVSGSLEQWNEETGYLRIRYRARRGSDEVWADFQPFSEGFLLHPAVFDGSFEIELKGAAYPESAPLLIGGLTGPEAWRISFGRADTGARGRALADWIRGEEAESLDRPDAGYGTPGRRYSARVKVDNSVITGYFDRKRVLHGRKPRGVYGRVGFHRDFLPSLQEVVIEGQAQPSWLQNLRDAALAEERTAFEARYDPADHLPGWLIAGGGAASPAAPRGARVAVPGKVESAHEEVLARAHGFFERGEYEDGFEYVDGLGRAQISAPARSYLLAEFCLALDRYDEAERHLKRSLPADPDFLGHRLLQARLLAVRETRAEAIAAYRRILADHPRAAVVHLELARMLLHDGRPGEAKQVVDTAAERGIDPGRLDELNRVLVKALNGPSWARSHRAESLHYVVTSDIDREACSEAAQVLEEAHQGFQHNLRRARRADGKLRVYLFSGQAGYQRYILDVIGGVPENSAGVYVPALKQLLIWNLPDREQMMRTVRHEGFHQYLDSLTEDAPVWFNEGLAEYYEYVSHERGRWVEGELHPQHMALLDRDSTRFMPLPRFLQIGHEEFMQRSETMYAQSWAFVHFLRHSTKRNQDSFDRLFDLLASGRRAEDAVEIVFGDTDLAALQQEFAAYVRGLR